MPAAARSIEVTPEKEKARRWTDDTSLLATSATSTGKTLSSSSGSSSGDASPAELSPRRRHLNFGDVSLEEGSAPERPQGALADVLLDNTMEAPVPSEGGRVYWEAFFVVMPLFCGYASLFGLQHSIKVAFGLGDNRSSASHDFGLALSTLYIFNLIFRFAHNVLLGCVSPRGRVLISMTSMMLSMLVIAVVIMLLESHRICWVVLAYSLGGVAVGSFESNLLACLTPLGHRTKHIAIMGIPVGITTVLVGGFFLMGPPLNLPVTTLYFGVVAGLLLGMAVFTLRMPAVECDPSRAIGGQIGIRKFAADCRQFRQWLPQLWHYPLATAVDMFSLSCFSPGVALYIYDKATVNVGFGLVLPTDSFFAAYNTMNMLGGLLGRWLSYKLKPRHPLLYSVFNVAGVLLLLSRAPALAPLSTLLVMLGDGLIYGTISRYVDVAVPREFNLTALSYWLFIGDFGSVLGSNMISYVRDWVVGS